MVSLERLSATAVDETTLEALEHRHRYAAVRDLCRGRRVLDLCCGVGYGAAIVGEVAESVLGVDLAPGAIDEAQLAFGHLERVTFRAGDALATLADPATMGDIDIVLCFEGVEHIADGDALLDAFVGLAASGTTLVFSVPNSRRYEEDNSFHLTNFDRQALDRWIERFPGTTAVWEQWHAQGSLIAPEAGEEGAVPVAAPLPSETRPAGWASHYIVLVNAAAEASADALLSWAVEPVNARWLESLKRANRGLWEANARLANSDVMPRGTYSAAAASVIDRWRLRALAAESRVREVTPAAEMYHELRNRKAVKLALGAAARLRSARDRVAR